MDLLLKELISEGLLDTRATAWSREYQGEHRGTLENALLALDLVDEDGLLRALSQSYQMKAARADDLTQVDTALADRLPIKLSQSFSLCPLRLDGDALVVVVEAPLRSDEVQELRDLFGLELKQLVAAQHHVLVARQAVYGAALDHRSRLLEARLVRRRRAEGLDSCLERIAQASTFSAAVGELFEIAANHVEYCCLLSVRGSQLRVVSTAQGKGSTRTVSLPDLSSSLGAAIHHGGHFFGPLGATSADRSFFAAMSRSMPRWAFVAPVPAGGGATQAVTFYADNGPLGMTPRWVADISLLLSRLGQRGNKNAAPTPPAPEVTGTVDVAPAADVAPERASSEPSPAGKAPVTPAELAALERLRGVAAAAGTSVEAVVDELLRARDAPPAANANANAANAAIAGEVKDLFEKLAIDIPAQLAQGMQAAFRGMVPSAPLPAQGGAPAAPPPAVAAPQLTPSAPAAAVAVVVQPTRTEREVPSYKSRRRKTHRVKL